MESKFNFIAATQGGARPGGPLQTASGSVTKLQKHKCMQQLLILLLQADSCQRVSQNSSETSQCKLPNCKTMRGVLNHAMSCQAGKNCAVPQCSYSRQILDHWNNCNKKDCPVCQPVKRFIQNKQINATPRHAAPPAADVRRGYAAYQQALGTFPTTSVTIIPRTPLANRQSVLGPMVLFQIDAMQHSQMVGDGSMSGAKVVGWFQPITADIRNCMVHKVVHALFRPKDPTDPGLVAYARKIEGEVYEASTPFEYYDQLDKKLYKIQKEMEEMRQKRKKQLSKL